MLYNCDDALCKFTVDIDINIVSGSFVVWSYTHDNSDSDVDGFGLSVYDRVNKLSKHIPVRLSTILDTPTTVNLVEGGQAVLQMENLIAGYSGKADGKTYTFDAIIAPVDIEVNVGGKELSRFTSEQVRL